MSYYKKRRRLFGIVMLVILATIITSTLTVSAGWFDKDKIPIPTVKQDVFVYDEDNIIDDTVEVGINDLLVQFEEQTGAEYNRKIKMFPANIIANMSGLTEAEYFMASEQAHDVPTVDFNI